MSQIFSRSVRLNGITHRQQALGTVDAGYKNTVGSREECSYIQYVLITGTFSMGSIEMGHIQWFL